MSQRSLASSILGGAVVVLLSGVAAYLGARMGRQNASTAEPSEPAASDVDPATRDAIDRRIGYLEKRVDVVEDTAHTALELAKSREEHVGGATVPPAARDAGPDAQKPRGPDADQRPAPVDPTDRDAVVARMTAAYRVNKRNLVVGQMAAYADTTRDAAANRNLQANSDARELMAVLDLRGDDLRDQLAKIFRDRLESAARDIGPIVRDGLERTDIATVRSRLAAIDAETDRKLRALFDDATWKRYEPNAAANRQTTDAVLDEFEKARLGGK
jgi:hypothetical protein